MGVIAPLLDDEIEIPDIEIEPGWLARDVATIEDCDDAFAILTAACAGIEMQIDLEAFKPLAEQRGEWAARAKAALRFKRAALNIVQFRRTAINDQIKANRSRDYNSQLLAFVKEATPADEWVRLVAAFNAGRVGPEAA